MLPLMYNHVVELVPLTKSEVSIAAYMPNGI
jgi:hypothetical protein